MCHAVLTSSSTTTTTTTTDATAANQHAKKPSQGVGSRANLGGCGEGLRGGAGPSSALRQVVRGGRVAAVMRDYISLRAQALLAKKPVKRGDVILTSKPFCTLLDSSVIGCYCEYCFVSFVKDRLLMRCSGCGRAYYCSEMCRDLGRALHWRECAVFRRRPNYQPKDSARFLARLIWVLKVSVR
ncbi:Histone-lysine N-methyltransferase SMYD3 [Portunus trituberculatus]|uniref:Histone-lysine N-methyltransferase SMYD3 n=1 Tax=Portunus trituberculatus TaxID=210409 RepID=A0A5B7D575_PORTR|nr:Histone-lysine N-methyltransferase SMYD3 [Portunus trituberculatus]